MVDCPICYTLFGSGGVDSEAHAFRGCGHAFCRGCIAQLTQIGCPVCRWKPLNEYAYASNLSRGVVLRLFIDFSKANTLDALQTRMEDNEKKLAAARLEMDRFKEEVRRDAEKKLATARLEMERSKEEVRRETERLQRKWKDEADSLKAQLEKAHKDVEYLTRRLEDEKLSLHRSTKDTTALVPEGVKTIPRQHMPPIPSSNTSAKPPHILTVSARASDRTTRTPLQLLNSLLNSLLQSTKAKAQAPTTTTPDSSNMELQLPPNEVRVETEQASESVTRKVPELVSTQPPSPNSRHIQPTSPLNQTEWIGLMLKLFLNPADLGLSARTPRDGLFQSSRILGKIFLPVPPMLPQEIHGETDPLFGIPQ